MGKDAILQCGKACGNCGGESSSSHSIIHPAPPEGDWQCERMSMEVWTPKERDSSVFNPVISPQLRVDRLTSTL